MVDGGGRKGHEQHGQQTQAREEDPDDGDHAQGLKGAVLDAQPDKVAVGTVAEEVVDVVGDGSEGVGGKVPPGDRGHDLFPHRRWDVEFPRGVRGEVPRDNVREFLAPTVTGPGMMDERLVGIVAVPKGPAAFGLLRRHQVLDVGLECYNSHTQNPTEVSHR